MIVLVTGAAGFVGERLVATAPAGVSVVGTWRHTRPLTSTRAVRVDLADRDETLRMVAEAAPEVVVHTAYTTTDLDRDVVTATANVAEATAAAGAALVHLSSDVVFSGEDGPYDEWAEANPISAYGRAKAAAEHAVQRRLPDAAIVRTSLVLTPETLDPRTDWIIDAARNRQPVDLYVDEIRMPVHRDDLVAGLWALVELSASEASGMWHLAGLEALSRYELGRLVVTSRGLSADLLRPAPSPCGLNDPRPRDLRLRCGRAIEMLGWSPRSVTATYARILSASDAERR